MRERATLCMLNPIGKMMLPITLAPANVELVIGDNSGLFYCSYKPACTTLMILESVYLATYENCGKERQLYLYKFLQ